MSDKQREPLLGDECIALLLDYDRELTVKQRAATACELEGERCVSKMCSDAANAWEREAAIRKIAADEWQKDAEKAWRMYEEIRKATDGGSESMTHQDAIEAILYWKEVSEIKPVERDCCSDCGMEYAIDDFHACEGRTGSTE